ncbi:hypothetical protein [Bradyrhizobium sp. Cp5.3]|uniref:hypothetical protein n=1 Tax=Bradyrhizobium sp. Cp5.3 TaxID=443598 RepID=UPI0005560E81|nr:hypothetical protein [Bradyrhizobium sp. Cp5.3]
MTVTEIEARTVEAIRKADHFTASLFLGRGQYRIEQRPTVLAAMQAARDHLRHCARRPRHAADRRANRKTTFTQIVRPSVRPQTTQ